MDEQLTFEFEQRPTIKGFPELRWTGKRPYRSTQYYPAQLRESYGEEQNGWINKLFWGDNLQVMSHLLKEYRGKIDLIYIDPPFDSKADYKKKIDLKGIGKAISDSTSFEDKQYGDIWTNDEYLQFMYERLLIMRELLSETGSIYLHCDWHRSAYLRLLLDEVFGPDRFRNEIVWSYFGFKRATSKKFPQKHDLIFSYTKSSEYTWNVQYKPHSPEYIKRFKKDENGRLYRDDVNPTGGGTRIIYLDEVEGDMGALMRPNPYSSSTIDMCGKRGFGILFSGFLRFFQSFVLYKVYRCVSCSPKGKEKHLQSFGNRFQMAANAVRYGIG